MTRNWEDIREWQVELIDIFVFGRKLTEEDRQKLKEKFG